jgi:hypothetical protein
MLNARKQSTSSLTVLTVEKGLSPEVVAHLERDRWPEFERELRQRRVRRLWFALCEWNGERAWGWMIHRCRKWGEVERVLNRHNIDYHWKHRGAVLQCEEAQVHRVP